jgi:hypothetical protein
MAISKYHNHLSSIKKIEAKFKLQLISKIDGQNFIKSEFQKIKKLKIKSYLFLVIVGLVHLLSSIVISSNLLSAGIPFLIFSFILVVNYWLKGNSVSGFIKNIPGQSDYHA